MAEVDLCRHLRNLIEGSKMMSWTYGIFWRCSEDRLVLNFHDGYLKGTEMVNAFCNFVALFFEASMTQRFVNSEDLPGHAFFNFTNVWSCGFELGSRWKRTRRGQEFGIQTFFVMPFKEKGVLELGSTEIIPYDLTTMYFSGDPTALPSCPLLADVVKHIRHAKSFPEGAYDHIQNCESHNLYNQFRAKEKISDSKASWPLLTESSDTGTNRTSSRSTNYSGPSRIYYV